MMRRILLATTALTVIPIGAVAAAATLQGTVSHAKGNAALVVYVAAAQGTFAPPKTAPTMDQKGMRFVPHVLPIVVGTTVKFLNSDPVGHNVFSPDEEGYNLGTWTQGTTRSYTFKRAGVYTQLCSIHPEMEGYIVVLQNPYYAVTGPDGGFKIELPPGHYELKVWGEHLKSKDTKKTFPVDVAAGGATTTIAFGS